MASKTGTHATKMISEKRFRRIVESYGSNSRNWPESERDGAMRFAETHERAAIYMAEPAALDSALNRIPAPKPADETLITQIVAAARRADDAARNAPQTKGSASAHRLRWLMPRILGLAAACGIGLLLGFVQLGAQETNTASIDASVLIYGATGFEDDLRDIN